VISFNQDQIRSFVAIELTSNAKEFLAATIQQLRPDGPDVKWVRPEAMHLTLKFLGSVNRDLIPELERSLEPVFRRRKPFEVAIRAIGAFPSPSAPRVVWAGLADPSDALIALAAAVEEVVEPLGFPREKRPFRPHLTIGRVKSPRRSPQLANAITTRWGLKGPSFQADHAILFQSILKPAGAEYIPLRRFQFG
jgi:RNA 2',3'-cyclic 3'-phosphodiesterase